MRVFADTAWAPLVHVEALASGQVPEAELLGASRDEAIRGALTTRAVGLELIFDDLLVMLCEGMAAEAIGLGADAEALLLPWLHLVAGPRHVHLLLDGLICVLELPFEHHFGAGCWSDLLYQLEDLVGTIGLNHI